jgi:hypothetical protein
MRIVYVAKSRTEKFWKLVSTMRAQVDATRIKAERNRRRYRKLVQQLRDERED